MNIQYISSLLILVLLTSCRNQLSFQKITSSFSGTYEYLSWSPDGKQLAVIYKSVKAGEDSQLLVYDLEIDKWKTVRKMDEFNHRDVGWLDNNEIIFVYDPNLDDWNSDILFYSLNQEVETYQNFDGFIIDLDVNIKKNKIAIVRDSLQSDSHDQLYGISIFDINTGKEDIIYLPSLNEDVQEVAWSPDGRFIAYTIVKPNPEKTNRIYVLTLHILDQVTNTTSILIEDSQLIVDSISWSRDGNKIIARVIDNEYQSDIGMIAMDGSINYIDAHNTTPWNLAPSPTDDILALTSLGTPGSNAVYLMYDAFDQTKEFQAQP